MSCLNCRKAEPRENDKFCSDSCTMEFLNNLRLFYQEDLSGEREMIIIQSRIGLIRLIKDNSLEELALRAQIYIEAATHIKTLIYSTKHRDELYARVEREADSKLHIAHEVSERDSKKILSAEELRLKQSQDAEAKRQKSLKKELKKTGDIPSPDNKCQVCGKESVSLYCSGACKKRWKMLKQWIAIGMSAETAKAKIMELDPSMFQDEDETETVKK